MQKSILVILIGEWGFDELGMGDFGNFRGEQGGVKVAPVGKESEVVTRCRDLCRL
jgi:hypothetical protein